MYFVFSKILLFLLYPMVWIFVLLIIALAAKNAQRRRRLLIAAVILLYIFSNTFLLTLYAKLWDIPPYPKKNTRTYSCEILLGGFTMLDNDGNGMLNISADRYIEAVKLLTTGKAKHLLMSGGNGSLLDRRFSEADWTKTQLKDFNFPDTSILIEDRSRNTMENASYSKVILARAHLKPPYLLVTSAFHMRRSMMIFQHQGINVVPYPANYLVDRGDISFSDFLPDGSSLLAWNLYTKELVGYVIDYFKVR